MRSLVAVAAAAHTLARMWASAVVAALLRADLLVDTVVPAVRRASET